MTWVPILRALPALGERVLIAHESRVEIAQRTEVLGRFAWGWEAESGRTSIAAHLVTHWMPLPPRP